MKHKVILISLVMVLLLVLAGCKGADATPKALEPGDEVFIIVCKEEGVLELLSGKLEKVQLIDDVLHYTVATSLFTEYIVPSSDVYRDYETALNALKKKTKQHAS